jgi:hypothetical protein
VQGEGISERVKMGLKGGVKGVEGGVEGVEGESKNLTTLGCRDAKASAATMISTLTRPQSPRVPEWMSSMPSEGRPLA